MVQQADTNRNNNTAKTISSQSLADAQQQFIDATCSVGEDGTVIVNVGEGEYPTLQREKEPKPRNQMERLERTAAKATDRVDFYERVVRSVAREETDLKEYNEVLGKKKTKYNKVPKVTGLGK